MKNLFIKSAAGIFFITGLGKVIAFALAPSSAQIFQTVEPFFGITFGALFFGIGLVELALSAFCLFATNKQRSVLLITILATNILLYRIALVVLGYHQACNCLGSFADALPISQDAADKLMKAALGYLLLGGIYFLFIDRDRTARSVS